MLNIGCHLSISKGFYRAGLDAVSIGANTFQFFTRNPRGGSAREIDTKDIEKLQGLIGEYSFKPLFAHAAYTMNLCSDKKETREFAKRVLKDDLERLKLLPESYYIFHPGSHVGQGIDRGVEYIVEALNDVMSESNDIVVLLEGMSGKGSEVGGSLEEIKLIINGVKHNKNLGICLDTCHMYSGGLDIVNNLDSVIDMIENTIGFHRVRGVHLNDSKTPFASNKDRHEIIGEGSIGFEGIVRIINHPKMKDMIFNLETPNEIDGYKKEIEMLKRVYKD